VFSPEYERKLLSKHWVFVFSDNGKSPGTQQWCSAKLRFMKYVNITNFQKPSLEMIIKQTANEWPAYKNSPQDQGCNLGAEDSQRPRHNTHQNGSNPKISALCGTLKNASDLVWRFRTLLKEINLKVIAVFIKRYSNMTPELARYN